MGMSQDFPGFLPIIFSSAGETRFFAGRAESLGPNTQSRDHSVPDSSTLFLTGMKHDENTSYLHHGVAKSSPNFKFYCKF
jgi:hypothetical protein